MEDGQEFRYERVSRNEQIDLRQRAIEGDADALRILIHQAELGDVEAMERVAVVYEYGARDDRQAIAWWRQAGEAGSTSAPSALGELLINTNRNESVLWLELAVNAGDTQAMRNLAYALNYRDYEQSIALLEKACELGDADACAARRQRPERAPWYFKITWLAEAGEQRQMKLGRARKKTENDRLRNPAWSSADRTG